MANEPTSVLTAYESLLAASRIAGITEGGWLVMARALDDAAADVAYDPSPIAGPFSDTFRKLTDRADDCRARAVRAARTHTHRETCQGCDEPAVCSSYEVTHHSGAISIVRYCDDCEALARMDWNGETAAIAPVRSAA